MVQSNEGNFYNQYLKKYEGSMYFKESLVVIWTHADLCYTSDWEGEKLVCTGVLDKGALADRYLFTNGIHDIHNTFYLSLAGVEDNGTLLETNKRKKHLEV